MVIRGEIRMNEEKKLFGIKVQLLRGLLMGVIFGFLLQKGGATNYDVIVGQLLLRDHTVLKIMLSAVATGMVGVYYMKNKGWIKLHPKKGSVGQNVIGGLIFGAGFAILGYCPGTIAGAVGNGYLDAVVGGVAGIMIGAGIFAAHYPYLNKTILKKGNYGDVSLPELLGVNDWVAVVPVASLIILLLYWMETLAL